MISVWCFLCFRVLCFYFSLFLFQNSNSFSISFDLIPSLYKHDVCTANYCTGKEDICNKELFVISRRAAKEAKKKIIKKWSRLWYAIAGNSIHRWRLPTIWLPLTSVIKERLLLIPYIGGWVNQADSRLSTTHGHITDCKLDSVVYVGVCVVISYIHRAPHG